MRRIIAALLLSAFSTTWTLADEGSKPIELKPDAPDRHIVVPGDTLWGLANEFLKDPYRWPELWRLNPDQIKNPQRIYPGQVLILDRSGNQPAIKVGELVKAEPKVYSEPIRKELPAIPQGEIEPYLSQPLVIEKDGLANAPRIIATEENRVFVGAGDEFFAAGIDDPATSWNVYRPGDALKDPDTKEVLGYEAVYLGVAKRTDEKAVESGVVGFRVINSKLEIGTGDRLIPVPRADVISYVPHPPAGQIEGKVLSLYGSVGEGATFSIIALSKGKEDGLEVGHVLAIHRARSETPDRGEKDAKTYKLPEQRYGLVFVFRVFDRISYALVMSVTRSITIGDVVRTP